MVKMIRIYGDDNDDNLMFGFMIPLFIGLLGWVIHHSFFSDYPLVEVSSKLLLGSMRIIVGIFAVIFVVGILLWVINIVFYLVERIKQINKDKEIWGDEK